jgi:hypothetical protein
MQRYLIIGAIVVVLAGIGAVAYLYFFSDTSGVEVAPSGGGNTSLPVAGGNEQVPVTEEPVVTVTSPVNQSGVTSSRLVKISDGPVVPGAIVLNKMIATSSPIETSVRYVERQSGNVYSYLVNTGTRTRISNRTVPGIQSAVWFPNASSTLVRYLSGDNFSTINSYVLLANGSGGFFLPQNLSDVTVSEAGILTLSSGVNGSIASLSRIDGTQTKDVFTAPLSSLRIGFAGKNQYLVFTKPSASLLGTAFIVDGAGRFSRVAGPLNGLVAEASPSGKWVLVSYTRGGAMQMGLVNTTTGDVLPLPVATIADKCVWTADDSAIYCGIPIDPSAGFNYPDDWYQGAVSFSDRIWKIDVSGRYAQFVLDFEKEDKGRLDANALAIDSLNTVLVFTNKNDSSIWAYSL